ncbi:ATP phosphoribosyltransferase regulatory subunit [Striga asiatica]|uniref:ATP phosphoribosyltransferase regulatory subunit n=1 Tax=Striga asiatica TaxID=4170 RepID=A0A5A7QVD8_STRAF|nr:ATP phosphoribosyltransferase regulatory subunit [Striga asiatica]
MPTKSQSIYMSFQNNPSFPSSPPIPAYSGNSSESLLLPKLPAQSMSSTTSIDPLVAAAISIFGTSISILRPSWILSKSHSAKCLSPGDAASLSVTFLDPQQIERTRRLSKGHPEAIFLKIRPSTWTPTRMSVRKRLNRMLSTWLSLHLCRCSSSRDSAKKNAKGRS